MTTPADLGLVLAIATGVVLGLTLYALAKFIAERIHARIARTYDWTPAGWTLEDEDEYQEHFLGMTPVPAEDRA